MKKIMILSGAGLSAESGIHTFRDSNGLWENYDVMQVCSTQGWNKDRQLVTEFYNARRADLASKKPNHAHEVLAQLEQAYKGNIIHLTQNVDNLMEKAGAKEVIHLHGTLTDLRCEVCHMLFDVGYSPQNENTSCPHCGRSNIRHNVVMFGEAAPEYRHIQQAIKTCSLFISIGTSGTVIDVIPIAEAFKHSIIIDPKRQETLNPYATNAYIDEYFEHFIEKKAGDAMEDMLAIVEEHMRL